MLALRGWGPEAFRLADPQFLALARHALMVERMLPIYYEAGASMDRDLSGLPPEAKGSAARAKMDAANVIGGLEPILFPEDDDG